MAFEKRQFERFDIILVIEFRALKKSLDYFPGVTRNVSHEGLSFEYHEFDIHTGDILDFKLKHLHKNFSVSAMGEIVWEKRSGLTCEAGIKFLVMNRAAKSRLMELTSMYREIPWESYYYDKDAGTEAIHKTAETSVQDADAARKEVLLPEKPLKTEKVVSQSEWSDAGVADERKLDKNVISAKRTPVRIKGRRRKKRVFPSIASVLTALLCALVIITFQDIDTWIPDEEKPVTEEIKVETAETPNVMDTVGIEPEPVQEMVPEEEQGTVGNANEPVETALADGQHISQPPHTVQRGSFFDIGQFVVATGIADREPVGVTNVFSSLTETVYCFLEARHITEDEAVNLAWYHEGSKMAEVELPLRKGQRWRTYSSKKLKGMRGIWKVELQDMNGSVLETVTFTVE